jgi:hypothetical protein
MQNQRAVWAVRAERSLQPRIDPEDFTRPRWENTAQEAVQRLADLPGVETVDVQTKPGWWPVVSYLPQRISIEVNERRILAVTLERNELAWPTVMRWPVSPTLWAW